MEKALFNGSFVSFAEQQQAEQRTSATMTFIFTDFRPNGNKQAVPKEERENLMASALYKPVKIAYDGHAWAGHAEAVPIGPITRVFDVEDALVAEAVIWKHEFPEIYQLLSTAAQEDPTAINFSWEMQYAQSEVNDGVEWLRGCNVLAATIVQNPAYQGRTHLIALSEQMQEASEVSDVVELTQSSDFSADERAPVAEQVTHVCAENDADLENQLRALREEVEQLRKFRQSVMHARAMAQRADLLAQTGATKLAELLRHSQASQLPSSLVTPLQWLSELSDNDFASFLAIVTFLAAEKQQAAAEMHASAQVVVPDVILSSSTSALPSPKEVAQLLREYRSHHTKR